MRHSALLQSQGFLVIIQHGSVCFVYAAHISLISDGQFLMRQQTFLNRK